MNILTQRKISFWEITTRKGRKKYLVSSTKLGSYMLELDICQSIKVATKMLPSVGRIYLSTKPEVTTRLLQPDCFMAVSDYIIDFRLVPG